MHLEALPNLQLKRPQERGLVVENRLHASTMVIVCQTENSVKNASQHAYRMTRESGEAMLKYRF